MTCWLCASAKNVRMLSATIGPTSGTSSSCASVGVAQPLDVAEVPRQVLRRRLADMADAEAVEKARQRRLPARLDVGDQVGGALVGHPLERLDASPWSAHRVGQRRDQAGVDELVDDLLAQALDVERAPAGEVQDRELALRGAEEAAARSGGRRRPSRERPRCRRPGSCAACGSSGRSAARFFGTRATTSGMTSPARRTITSSPTRTPFLRTSNRLCSVAFETVVPPTKTGSSLATGVSLPVRPTWISIVVEAGRLLLRRILLRHRPARLARLEAEPFLEGAIVDLVDDAVDLVRQAVRASPRRRRGKRPARRRLRRARASGSTAGRSPRRRRAARSGSAGSPSRRPRRARRRRS